MSYRFSRKAETGGYHFAPLSSVLPVHKQETILLLPCSPKLARSKHPLQHTIWLTWHVLKERRSSISIRKIWDKHNQCTLRLHNSISYLVKESLWNLCMRSIEKSTWKVFIPISLEKSSMWKYSPAVFVSTVYTATILLSISRSANS